MSRWTWVAPLVALSWLAGGAVRASDVSPPSPGRRYVGHTMGGAPAVLTLGSDARAEMLVGGARYTGRWRTSAELPCVRFWEDDAPDLGCVWVGRVGGEALLLDEDGAPQLHLAGAPAGAIELPGDPW